MGQRCHNEVLAISKDKRDNNVKFKSSANDMNHVIQKYVSAVPYKKLKTKRNRDLETAYSDKEVCVYVINCLELGDAYNDSDSDSN